MAWLLWLRRAGTVRLVLIWHTRGPIGWDGVTAIELAHPTMPVSQLIEQLPHPGRPRVSNLARVPDTEYDRFLHDAETCTTADEFVRVR
ncbi:hypothetical protein [Nocardia farcinica]|uniref:hypothetical protein n=1 Tax=Nocardia farcinica TaxID=37329 RepID=UPI00032330D1|nr:hypothetical protein [Nocardia farcinica]UEX26138.1 hypothetical protein LMJ57_29575 [Nocardia farcinica]